MPDGGNTGYYDGGAAQNSWNDQSQYATWDNTQQPNPNNPFQSSGMATYGSTDPNDAWNQNGTNNYATTYGSVDNSSASFYETRAQYVQPGSNY